MTWTNITSQELWMFFEATTDGSQVSAECRSDIALNPRQIKRRKEKQVARWKKRMGPMPTVLVAPEGNLPKRAGRNLLDEDGNFKPCLIAAMGATGGAMTARKRSAALEARIRLLLEDPTIARLWGIRDKKAVIARKAGVTPATVGNWLDKFPQQ